MRSGLRPQKEYRSLKFLSAKFGGQNKSVQQNQPQAGHLLKVLTVLLCLLSSVKTNRFVEAATCSDYLEVTGVFNYMDRMRLRVLAISFPAGKSRGIDVEGYRLESSPLRSPQKLPNHLPGF